MAKKINTWRDNPKIINRIPTSKDTMIMYIDESGEGNKKVLKKAYEAKQSNSSYQERNDLYILNGIVLSGYNSKILKSKMDKLKLSIKDQGVFEYVNKGVRPIVLRNHDITSKNPPFNNMNAKSYEKIDKLIKNTKFIQIASGLNYY